MESRRIDVAFEAEGGARLRGWLFRPEPSHDGRLRPAITMAPGFGAVKEHGLERMARRFAAAGFVVLLHDHRSFGASDGVPRQDVDPWRQVADWRRAISFLEGHPIVDPARIGLWGIGLAGGHALVLRATERRLSAVVAHSPVASGWEQGRRAHDPDDAEAMASAIIDDERMLARGDSPRRLAIVSADPRIPAAWRTPDAVGHFLQPLPRGVWDNNVTLRSMRAVQLYDPADWVTRGLATPLLMLVPQEDSVAFTDLQRHAFERARAPKRLSLLPGGHFDGAILQFEAGAKSAVAWFREHLE